MSKERKDLIPPSALFGGGFVGINQRMRKAKPMKSLPTEKQVYGNKWDDLHF